MALTNYSDLLTAVDNWTVRDDLATRTPEFITLAEARLNETLFTPDREVSTTATSSTGTFALPTGFYKLRSAYVDGASDTPLQGVSLHDLQSSDWSGSVPQVFTIQNGNMLVKPAPSSSTSIVMNYYQAIPALTVSNTTNWLMTRRPDIYLATVLVEAFSYLMDETRMAFWEMRAAAKIKEAQQAGIERAHGGTPLAPRQKVGLGW